MLRKSFLISIILLLPVLLGCSSSKFIPEEGNFPLTKLKTYSPGKEILKFGLSDSYLVIETIDSVQGVDTSTDKILWEEKNFSIDNDSDILFGNGYAVLMSYDEIFIADKNGRKTFLNLNPKRTDNIRLVAFSQNYLYVIRGNLWVLEVYDVLENKLIWETPTGRGDTDVYYLPTTNTVYVVNNSSLRAFDNTTGILLWNQDLRKNKSAFANDVLYIAKTELNSEKYTIMAFNVMSHKIIWQKEFDSDAEMYIYGLDLFRDTLVMTTRYDYFAFDINEGNLKWKSSLDDIFYVKPVLVDKVLFAIGSSRSVYAISLVDGHTIGFVRLESDSSLVGEPSYEARSGVTLSHDGIAFKTKNSIEFYASK